MSRQPKLRPKSHIPGFPDAMYDLATMSSMSQMEARTSLGEDKHDQRVFRVKRKHVLKACDRCRVKKTKDATTSMLIQLSVTGNSHATAVPRITIHVSSGRGRLRRQRSIREGKEIYIPTWVLPAQRLRKEANPGLVTEQAEENADEQDEDSEDLQYLRYMASTDCSATTDPSPEPVTPPEPSPSHCSPVNPSTKTDGPYNWEYQPVHAAHHEQYASYQHSGFYSVTMPRSAVEATGHVAESKCSEALPPVSNPENSYYFYTGTNGNAESTKGPLHPGVTAGPRTHHHSTGMPAELLSNYSLHLHDQQSLYQGLAPSWSSYPCG
ncbi:C6 transcription factor [Aspergillus flavus]|nr:C6 transcription factor [Aspergillus flavus]RAQ65214.1 C6 transcription factor [Aspergillus flavus]RAQ65971.1 C6 transcription factor [Aspergillus flavus]